MLVLAFILLSLLRPSLSNELNPPLVTFDLSSGASASASSTCGDPPAQFSPSSNSTLLCNSSDPSLSYPASNLIDRDLFTRWQSRNTQSPVSVTISLRNNQTFEVYILIPYFYSLLSSTLSIEISKDGGSTYTPWQYFTPPSSDGTDPCQTAFGMAIRDNPYFDDEINPRAFCSLYPNVFEDPESGLSSFVWGPLQSRMGNTTEARLQFIRGTHIRLVMTGFRGLEESQQQYYGLGEVTLRGRCVCNGHASACDSSSPYKCSCQHNTAGNQCEMCLPLYNQQPWMLSLSTSPSSCEPCNCMQHADSCEYDQMVEGQSLNSGGNFSGGGVCLNCRNNTTGFNCERCANVSYRDPALPSTSEQTCKPCDCFLPGTRGGQDCIRNSEVAVSPSLAGDCFCKVGVGGSKCDRCQPQFYNTSAAPTSLDCSQCECSAIGSVLGSVCDDVTGQCVCKQNVGERRCDQCLDRFHTISLQGCSPCSCDVGGSLSDTCNKTSGYCSCRPGIEGQQCSQPLTNYHIRSLHYIHTQAEYGTGLNSQQLPLSANRTLFAGFLGQGFVVVGSESVQTFLISINVPVAATYRLVLRYSSQSMGFASFRFGRAGSSLDTQGVFSLSSSSPSYTQAYVLGSSSPLEVEVSETGMYVLNATRSGRLLVDVLVLIPVQYFQATLLGASTQNFTDNCDVITNSLSSEFCEDSAFSLSAYFVGEGIPCACNSTWSLSSSCLSLGGQCTCKPGVTGRTCDRCIYGYYSNGNEGCIPCQCPNGAICDVTSGQCPCLTGVTNRQCDECEDSFYTSSGDDLTDSLACSPCECSLVGSVSEVCDKSSGQCGCRGNVVGVSCGQCAPDHWNLSTIGCQSCGCDLTGSEGSQCHLTSGECSCKQLAEGMACDQCTAGSFLLSPLTPSGCTQCYCSGLSQNCSYLSGVYQDTPLDLSSDRWRVVSFTSAGDIRQESVSIERERDSINVTVSSSLSPLYLSYPLNQKEMNLLLSYGDSFKFSLTSSVSHSSLKLILYHPSRIIEFFLSPLDSGRTSPYTAPLLEYNWTAPNASPVTRGAFLDLLVSSPSLLIPIGEGGSFSTQLSAVSVPRASVQTTVSSPRALPVERCQCPIEYSGLSCQTCSTGYFRGNNGTCIPCECNGHSNECDPDNGTCISCQDNTGGDRCQVCASTYFGDATRGTDRDCQSCPCSTYTATTLSCSRGAQGEPVCSCKEGHIGNLCNRCDGSNNFYGDPVRFPNTSCSQCICSGNIDFSVPNSCNTTTGQCTLCINNSTGSSCDQCLGGFYGNASIQTCQTCQCNSAGSVTLFCESNSGQCYCRPNVTDRQCDSCLQDHFNFSSLGCSPCLCDETGSNQSQCDLSTGQCSCKFGVGGRTCDECSLGYFNFSSAGCSPCLCGIGFVNQSCDMNTGDCYCQPGVNGAKCDQCLPFYENLTSSGCSSCDACTEQLGNRAMSIEANELMQVAAKVSELETVSEVGESSLSSHLTVSRAINSSLQQYKEELTQHHDKIIEINAGAINGSADAIGSYLSLIVVRSDGEGNVTRGEFMRIRELALSVEMALGLLEQTQTATSSLVPMLQSQVGEAMLVLLAARQLLSSAQFNYSANVYRAMETLSDAEMTFDRSLQVKMQLSSQQSQISDLNQIVISLNSSLLSLQSSLNNLKERNEDNILFISEIRSILIRSNISVMDFYGILTTIRSRIIDIRSRLNASVQVHRLAEGLYTSAADTLRGSPQAEQSHNLESGDSYIESNITTLKQLHSNLTQLLAQAEMHRSELSADTSLIESAYNSTQPAALAANKAIADYQEVYRLINASCILATSSLQVAVEAAQQSAALIQQGILEQVALELRVARTLLNVSLQLRENVSYLTSEELPLLQANLSLILNISRKVEGEVNQLLIEIDPLIQFYVHHVNGILAPLPAYKSCISSNSSLVGKFLSQIESIIPQLIRRISNCSDRIREYNDSSERADSLLNSTISALVERVQSISTSVALSDANMGKLQSLESKVEVIESIRDRAFAAVARLKVALALQRNYSFTYRTPNANVALEYTQVSLYFKPTLTTGLLFFAQTSSRQFLSLHLDEGVLVFSIELGSGLKNISIGGVLPQQWYQVLATRDYKQLTMSLAEQSIGENQISKVEGSIDFSKSLLFPPNEPLFLGHKPKQANVIDLQNFEGCVQDLSFNHMPISLFNPIENVTTLSCGLRSVTRRYTNGTWFYGGGYLIFTQPHLPYSALLISFRTFNDGILGSTSNNEQSIIFRLAITGGKIEFSIRERQFVDSLGSTISVVDGEDHEVSILIDTNRISLQVDQMSSGQLQLRKTNFSLASLNIGGDPGSAVSESFSGVVTELRINGLLVDLSQALNVSRVVPFTPVDVTPGAYHSGTGYAQFSLPQSTMPLFSFKFSFRSTALTGLLILLFAADPGSSPIHLSLEHGRLMFSFMYLNASVIRQGFMTLGDNLNDGNFHVVRVEIMSNSTTLSVDQLSMTSPNLFNESCEIIVSTSLFVGGVPDSKRLLLPYVTSYKGCIRNLAVNNITYNYTDANFTSGVSLYGCEPAIEPPTPTTMPPITPTVSVSPSFPSVLSTFIATQSLSQFTPTPTPTPLPTSIPTPLPLSTSIPTLQTSLLSTLATFLTSIPITPSPMSPVILTSSLMPVFSTSLSTPSRSPIFTTISPIFTTISSLPTISPTPTPTPTPLPVNACQIYPDKSSFEPESSGFRFDSFNGSYVLLNVNATELATDTVFRIEFSSITYNGNIFFVNGRNNFDLIELKFVAGKIRFSFSLGSFPIHIITSYRYDDGVKYRVEATRLGTIGLLTVLQIVGKNIYRPREYLRTQVDDPAFTKFDLSNNFYFGGLPNKQVSADMCVTSLVINKQERLLSSGTQYRVSRCYSKISRGATFSGSESYLKLLESFPAGRNLTVQFDFRTFNQSGLLFYIANPVTGDHVTLELSQGSLVYSVDNGEIPIVIIFTPPAPYTLCNGLWHSVLLTKQDNDISITVDGTRLEDSINDSFVSVDTKSYPLFLGGIEPGLTILSHVSVVPFRGCIREVLLNDDFYSLSSPQADNNQVIVAGCVI